MLESKLNHNAIDAFAELFTQKVCDAYFENTDSISGREIVEVTPVKQVNYFILKILFRKWQKETLRLQSPYFNYRNEDVRKALLSFMNVLSQQIKVNRENFEPLLRQATRESLLAIISPHDFFKEELTGHESGRLNDKYLKNSAKYIKINKHIFEAYALAFEEKAESELTHADAITLLNEVFSKGDLSAEDVAEYEKQFNELTEIDFSMFLEETSVSSEADSGDEEVDEEDDAEEQDDSDELDDEQDDDDEDALTVEDSGEIKAVAELNQEDELVKFVDEDQERKPEFDSSEESEEDVEGDSETRAPFKFSEKEESDEEGDDESALLNKQFSSEKTPLHEQLKSEQRPSLAEVHQSQKIESITGSITVNQRYMFVNELFSNDGDLFVEAMGKVEGCESFDEAVELLIQSYSKKLEWDMNAPEVKELLKIVFKKFR